MWPFSSSPFMRLNDLHDEYDYVVVGGGTAGCVLANRLSASPQYTVLLIERGPAVDSWISRVPLLSASLDGSPLANKIQSITDRVTGRPVDIYQGTGLGGASLINHMVYTRGPPGQFDRWERNGAEGWGSKALLPYFIKSESAQYEVNSRVHGTKGEWSNRHNTGFFYSNFQLCADASEALGLPQNPDLNDPDNSPIGWARFPVTRDAGGHRISTARAFLSPGVLAARRANLHVCPGTIVERLVMEKDGDDIIARFVIIGPTDAKVGNGITKQVRVRGEVVLCAGTFGSPQVLLLSGIGPTDHLKEVGIPVLKDLPVGENLQDHFGVFSQYFSPLYESLLRIRHQPLYFIMQFIEYLLYGTGVLLAPVVQMGIFACTALLDVRGVPSTEKHPDKHTVPDIEIMPLAYARGLAERDKSRGGFSYLTVLLTPESRGTVRLSSADPRATPKIDLNYLSAPGDRERLRQGLRLSMRIAEKLTESGNILQPAEAPRSDDDEALDAHIKDQACTTYHYSSSCAIGKVVGNDLIVKGTRNVRVADTSVFPEIPATHLQALAVAVAEKCADMVLGAKIRSS
ncbi:GMC oxidoreductase [Scleroderma yunnanense]